MAHHADDDDYKDDGHRLQRLMAMDTGAAVATRNPPPVTPVSQSSVDATYSSIPVREGGLGVMCSCIT